MNRLNEATRTAIEQALKYTPSQKADIAKITQGRLFGVKMVFGPDDIHCYTTLEGIQKQIDSIIKKSPTGVGMLHYLAVNEKTGGFEMLSAVVRLK